MTIAGYVPAIGETDLDKITRSIRNLYENGAAASDVVTAAAILYTAQTLTSPQQAQALANLGVTLGSAASNVPQLDASAFLPVAGAWSKINESVVGSAVATVDITATSGFASQFDTLCLEFINLVPVTDDVRLSLRVGTGSTPTWQSSAAAYGWGFMFNGVGGGTAGQGSQDANAIDDRIALTAGTTAGFGVANAVGASGRVFIWKPNAVAKPLLSYATAWMRGGGGQNAAANGAGAYLTASAITGLRLFFSSGNIASGTVRLWGIHS